MASPIANATEAVETDFGGYDPQDVDDLRGLFEDMPNFWETFNTAWTALASKVDSDLPVNPAVAEGVREMGALIAGLKDTADELLTQFQTSHEPDLQRQDEPRPAEELWNV